MPAVLMTGFPGFLGSALLPRLLAGRPETEAVCVVQDQHLVTARCRLRELEAAHRHLHARVHLVTGDITRPGLGTSRRGSARLREVTEVWHLAAVYDLAVPAQVAQRVNVGGTRNVVELCGALPDLHRLQYVSTCYVSGAHSGEFAEDGLEEGQTFRNHYESTKYDAELLVRKAMADGMPATIYRPGIVVGDSATGATQKYDGPYFVASYLRRFPPPIAPVPRVTDPDRVRFGIVPRDYVVDAMDALSVQDRSLGRTYALIDPDPPTIRELVETFARRLGRRVAWVPLPLGATRSILSHVPGARTALGLPAEALDYLASPTTFSTANTVRDLADTEVRCPRFHSYADRMLDFMLAHPEVAAAAMV